MTRLECNPRFRRPAGGVLRQEAGFTLPFALFTLALLSLAATGGFILAWAELRSSQAFGAGVTAFYVSDGGLQQTMAGITGTPPPTQTLVIGAGQARVTATRLLTLGYGESLYRLSSQGTVVGPRAETYHRTVDVVAWTAEPPLFPAAITSSTGFLAGAANGIISGLDQISGCSGRYTGAVAGVAAPASGPISLGPGLQVTGLPAVRSLAPGVSLRHVTGLSWTDLTAVHGPPRDASIPPDPWPPPLPAGSSRWLVIDLHASPARLDAGNSGRGALIARGDLQLDAGFRWRGLILVGGALRVRGDIRVDGAIVAGLDSTAVSTPGVDLGTGQIDIRFDACAAEAAAGVIAPRPAAQPGTWHEEM
jgi:hypothetical protein